MQRATFLFLAIIFMSFFHGAYGQYLPIGILPMEYNPSFAGSVGNSRLITNFSLYSSDNNEYGKTSGGIDLSYDKYFPAIRSGIGITTNGSYTNGTYPSYGPPVHEDSYWSSSIDLMIAPKISIKGKYTISPSIGIKYINQIHRNREQKNSYVDVFAIKSGILFNTSKYYIGYAIEYNFDHFYSSNYYDYSGLTTAFQLGYTFQKSIDSKFSFTPQLALPLFIGSGFEVYWPSYNLSFRYASFILGATSQFMIEYPTGFQLGWQNKGWRILLSNDFTDKYTANFTLRYIFNHDKKSRNIMY